MRFHNQFSSDQRGSVALFFGLSLFVLVVVTGLAVDGSRWNHLRTLHARAVDAGLLAGARYLSLNPDDVPGALSSAQSIYRANIAPNTQMIDNTVTFVTADSNKSVTFSGTASMQTMFLQVIGYTTLPITTPAKASLAQSGSGQGSDLEISVMLDVTGSMCDDGTGPCSSGTKLDGVKQAATKLANVVLGQSSSNFSSRIALVPFSSAIRIDEDGTRNPLMQTLTGMPQNWSGWVGTEVCTGGSGYYNGEFYVWTSQPTCTNSATQVSNWLLMPCVTERAFANTGFDPGDSAPGAGNWLQGQGGDRFPLSWDSSDGDPFVIGTPGNPGYSGLSQSDPTWEWDYSPDGGGCMSLSGNDILPLTSTLASVTARINSLQAYGPTAGALGTAFAQYMLSPKWSGIWSGSSAPGSYADTHTLQSNGAPLLRKVAVLMTDGGFNTYRQYAVSYTDDGGQQMQAVSSSAIQVCDNMKSNGVEIFTVGFNLNALSPGEQAIATATLQACGTDLSHFYNSLTVPQLETAFSDIAVKLSPIRLSQ